MEQFIEDCPDRIWDGWLEYFNLEPEAFGMTRLPEQKSIEETLAVAWGTGNK